MGPEASEVDHQEDFFRGIEAADLLVQVFSLVHIGLVYSTSEN